MEPIKEQEINTTPSFQDKIGLRLYKFFVIYGLIGLIVAVVIPLIDKNLLNLEMGFAIIVVIYATVGQLSPSLAGLMVISFQFWPFWLLLGWAAKSSINKKHRSFKLTMGRHEE